MDVEFVRKAVRAIGRCAIKLERAAERCINVLLELIQTKVNYVLQEAVIVIKVYSSGFSEFSGFAPGVTRQIDSMSEEGSLSVVG